MNTTKNNKNYIISVSKKKTKRITSLSESTDESLIISSYNILASGNTHYNWRNHKNVNVMDVIKIQDNDVLIKTGKEIQNNESITQTRDRYKIISNELINSKSDIICLQECDYNFFNNNINPKSTSITKLYDIHIWPTRDKTYGNKGKTCILKLKKSKKIYSTKDPLFINSPESYSKGAVCLPIKLQNDKNVLIVSAHFSFNSSDRVKLVKEIENIYLKQVNEYIVYPRSKENTMSSKRSQWETCKVSSTNSPKKSHCLRPLESYLSLIIMGDFNVEGPICMTKGRKDYLSMEMGEKRNTSSYITPYKSFWYNTNCMIKNNYMTGLNGELTFTKNLDHVFVYSTFFNNVKLTCANYDSHYGPYEENKSFSNRIGGKKNNRELKFDDIYEYFMSNCKPNPAKIVRGSDHKLISIKLKI